MKKFVLAAFMAAMLLAALLGAGSRTADAGSPTPTPTSMSTRTPAPYRGPATVTPMPGRWPAWCDNLTIGGRYLEHECAVLTEYVCPNRGAAVPIQFYPSNLPGGYDLDCAETGKGIAFPKPRRVPPPSVPPTATPVPPATETPQSPPPSVPPTATATGPFYGPTPSDLPNTGGGAGLPTPTPGGQGEVPGHETLGDGGFNPSFLGAAVLVLIGLVVVASRRR